MRSRVFGVAGVRFREAARGPLAGFLLLFLVLAAAAALLTPGEPGPDRQRAVDRHALDAALLVTVLAAAVFGAAALPDDRETGREAVLAAGPLRGWEILAGGLLGHFAALAILAAACFAGFVGVTGLLAEGDGARAPTRSAIRANELLDARGVPATKTVRLTKDTPGARYLLPAPRAEIEAANEGGDARCFVRLDEILDVQEGVPDAYEVAVLVNARFLHRVEVRRGQPLAFSLDPREMRTEPGTPIEIRRLDPRVGLGLVPGGLLAEGPVRSFSGSVAAAAGAWLLLLAVMAAAAAVLSTLLGAPVAVAGTLIIALVGRSLPTLEEGAAHLDRIGGPMAGIGRALRSLAAIWPDLDAYDLTPLITARWAISIVDVIGRIVPALVGLGILLAAGSAVLAIRRRA